MENLRDFIIPRYSGAGIYAVINIDKMIAYVGQSHNINNRARQHYNAIKNKTHNIEEINRDSEDNFIFTVLYKIPKTEVTKEKLDLYEKLFMLGMLDNGLYLYNKQNVSEYGDEKFLLCWYICSDLMSDIGVRDSIKDVFYNKYNKAIHHIVNNARKTYKK